MCGICGIFSLIPISSEFIVIMNETLKHRGPDDEGYILFDFEKVIPLAGKDSKVDFDSINGRVANLFLGHRRLSILDLSVNGHQPMSDINQKVWIVFNGEIYNYLEIRELLESKGYKFKTRTDTEVIIYSYLEWGYRCVDLFDGMWAFVILDVEKNILFGSRDRFGVKPLYFYKDDDKFIFASEIKAIVKNNLYRKSINEKAVADYIKFGFEEQNVESFFSKVFQLLPSHSFELNLKNNELKIFRYYNLEYNNQYEKFDKSKLVEYSNKVRELVFKAIEFRLRSDVVVGSCLSGGIDSSTIVCCINEILQEGAPTTKDKKIENIGEKQKVFSAVFPNEPIDESKWMKIVAEKTNAQWFYTTPNFDELIDSLEDLVYYQDIPFGSTSIFAQYKVMELASRNGVKVLLDGQGGDEVFTGYIGYYKTFFYEIIKNRDFLKLFNELNFIKNYLLFRKDIVRIFWRVVKKEFLSSLFSIFTKSSNKPNYSSETNYSFIEDFVFYEKNIYYLQEIINSALWKRERSVNEHLYKQLNFNLINLLRYEDRNSMRFSIEARTPFADYLPLIEYVFSIPSTYKIHDGFSKYILRFSMKGIVPDEILNRTDKIGFQTPQEKWIFNNKQKLIDLIDKEFIKKYINLENIEKDENYYGLFWRLINLSIWKKVFFA